MIARLIGTRIIFLIFSTALLCASFTPSIHASPHPYLSEHGIVLSSGNKHLVETDISLAGPVQTLTLRRYYNSQSPSTGFFGYGWSGGLRETSRLEIKENRIVLVRASGKRVVFEKESDQVWKRTTGKVEIIESSGAEYRLTHSDGSPTWST